MGFDDPAYQKLKAEILGKRNGNSSTSNGVPAVQKPQLTPEQALHDWRYHVGLLIKAALDDVPEKDREQVAGFKKPILTDTVLKQAKDMLAAHQAPVWPLPPDLSDSEAEEELDKLANRAVDVFRSAYLPAPVEAQLPAVDGEIDRTPIDAFEAYELIRADVRDYSWAGLVREATTMVLTALIGAGKTTLAMNVVRGWALGEPVLGRPCKQSKTLVIVSPKEFEAWSETIHFWGLRGLVYLIASHKTQFSEGALMQANWFEQTMKRLGCRTFVLDTLFDAYGLPPKNSGDSNRIAMAEQTPLLDIVRVNAWSGICTGHAPKSEAQALVARDPEEAFAGHTAWTAQHRMRAYIRRKAKGVSAFLTGRGGHGDEGVLEEHILQYDESTRLVTLGGKFANYLGEVALPSVIAALEEGGWHGRSDIIKTTGKGKNFVYAGVKLGIKRGAVKWNGKGGRSAKYAMPDEQDEQEQMGLL